MWGRLHFPWQTRGARDWRTHRPCEGASAHLYTKRQSSVSPPGETASSSSSTPPHGRVQSLRAHSASETPSSGQPSASRCFPSSLRRTFFLNPLSVSDSAVHGPRVRSRYKYRCLDPSQSYFHSNAWASLFVVSSPGAALAHAVRSAALHCERCKGTRVSNSLHH